MNALAGAVIVAALIVFVSHLVYDYGLLVGLFRFAVFCVVGWAIVRLQSWFEK